MRPSQTNCTVVAKRVVFSLLALIALLIGAYFSLSVEQPDSAMTGVWLTFSIFLFVVGWPEVVESISFLGNSIKLREFKNELNELKQLAKHNISFLLELAQTQMRFGGVPEEKKIEILDSTYEILKRFGFTEKEINVICSRWHYWVESDYVRYILGGSNTQHPEVPKESADAWSKVRKDYISRADSLSPDQLRNIFKELDALNPTLEGNIQDYEYYLEHKKHRDLAKWTHRHKNG